MELAAMEPGADGFIDCGVLETVSAVTEADDEFLSLDASPSGQTSYSAAVPTGRIALQVQQAVQQALAMASAEQTEAEQQQTDPPSLLDLMSPDDAATTDSPLVDGDVLGADDVSNSLGIDSGTSVLGMVAEALQDDMEHELAITELLKAVDGARGPVASHSDAQPDRALEYAPGGSNTAAAPQEALPEALSIVTAGEGAAADVSGLFADASLFLGPSAPVDSAAASTSASSAPVDSAAPPKPASSAPVDSAAPPKPASSAAVDSAAPPKSVQARHHAAGAMIASTVDQLLSHDARASAPRPSEGDTDDADGVGDMLPPPDRLALDRASSAEHAATAPMVAQAWSLIAEDWGIDPAAAGSAASAGAPTAGDTGSTGFLQELHAPDSGAVGADADAIKARARDALPEAIASEAVAALAAIQAQFVGKA